MTTYEEFDLQDKFYFFKLIDRQPDIQRIVERVLSNENFCENKTSDGRFIGIHEFSRSGILAEKRQRCDDDTDFSRY